MRGFDEVEEHDQAVIDGINSVCGKRDKLFILGDVTMEKAKPYLRLTEIPALKQVVLGNHDRPQDVDKLLDYASVCGCIKYKDALLTHIPVHPMELDYRVNLNIHAHIHEKDVGDPRYINVDAHRLNFKPLQWEAIFRTPTPHEFVMHSLGSDQCKYCGVIATIGSNLDGKPCPARKAEKEES
jgi:calcineurin-like phosphoesterase family protein